MRLVVTIRDNTNLEGDMYVIFVSENLVPPNSLKELNSIKRFYFSYSLTNAINFSYLPLELSER